MCVFMYVSRMTTFVSINIYSLFNDAFSSSDYIASDERMIGNNESESMWKEVVVD
jgi:hypothetical protein